MVDKKANTLLVALLATTFLFEGCDKPSAPAARAQMTPPAWHMVVFVDKTYSNELAPETSTSLLSIIARSYLTNIRDGLTAHPYVPRQVDFSIALVHENTLGSGFYAEYPLRLPPVDQNLGGLSQRDEKKKQREAIDEWLRQCQQSLRDALELSLNKQTSQHTDLWATFEVASRQMRAHPSADKYLIFISDMVESMKGSDRRDFHKKPPTSKEEAIAWAEADFAAIQRLYQVDPEAFKDARIVIFTPAKPMEANDLGMLRYYWEKLFEQAGVKEVVWKPLKQGVLPVN